MKEYNIASIPGDGIGKEVLPEGLKVLKDAALKHQFKINFTEYDFASCDYYEKHGKMLPDDWKEKLAKHDAIFFGAVGMPDRVPKKMAKVVDDQNKDDKNYIAMSKDFEKSIAFKASLDLVLEGNVSPSGYTEPILHKRRLELKAMLG